MSLDDLDLEFEDDMEATRPKKSDAVPLNVDLEFHTSGGRPVLQTVSKPAGVKKTEAVSSAVTQKPSLSSGNVSDISRKNEMGQRARPQIVGTSAMKQEATLGRLSSEVSMCQEQMRHLEIEAAVKVALAEFKTTYLVDILSDIKLIEHQVTQLLVRINTKHPDTKNEVLMIKKILADFTAKKRQ